MDATRPSTPSNQQNTRHEYNTIERARFFDAFDDRGEQSLGDVLKRIEARSGLKLPRRTAQYWLKQRTDYGSPSRRRTRRNTTTKLGPPHKLSQGDLQLILSPSRNQWREEHYQLQIQKLGLDTSVRSIRRNLFERCDGTKKFIQARTSQISEANMADRVRFGKAHLKHDVENFWQFVVFTDEFHYDPAEMRKRRVARLPGTRYEPANIQQLPPRIGSKLHCAAWVSWHEKAPKLIFYNEDEPKVDLKQIYPFKPRKGKHESKESHQQRVTEWEANKPPGCEIQKKGAGLTTKHYCEHILPHYIQATQRLQRLYGRALLQEDNDRAHGTKTHSNLAYQTKQKAGIELNKKPAQSPDLNASEGIWKILKQRLREVEYTSEEQLKQIAQNAWKGINQAEIQRRIADLPDRCYQLTRETDLA